MKRFKFSWIRARRVQLTLLFGLAVVATAVWAMRTSTPTVAIGDREVGDLTTEIAEAIGDKHGELCEEYGIGEFVGEFVETNLTSGSPLPAAAAALVQRNGMNASDYQDRHLDAERIVLVFRARDDELPPNSEILAHAVELKLFVNVDPDGTRAADPEWVETESSALYPCE